jgi:hypothetical protein
MKKALIIGLDNYGTNIEPSFGCINSATRWEYTLKDRFNFDIVKLLTDKDATTQRIKDEFNESIDSLEREDLFVFIFIGHGYNEDEDGDGNDEESDDKSEKMLTYDGKISDNGIREMLDKNTKNARIVLFIEACYNGSINEKSDPIFITEKANEIVFTACGSNDQAQLHTFDGLRIGVFTYYATKFLWESPTVNYVDFFRRVEFEIKNHQFVQEPQFIYTNENYITENIFSSYKSSFPITAFLPYILANPNIRLQTFDNLMNGVKLITTNYFKS